MKIYLAAPWVEKSLAQLAARYFVTAGHDITSRWLYNHKGNPTDASGLNSPEDLIRHEALEDIADIQEADVFVILNYQKSEGKAFEMGVAWMSGKPIISVFPRFGIFNCLGTEVAGIAEALAHIELLESRLVRD